MKTALTVLALLVNGVFLVVAGFAVGTDGVSMAGRVCAALVALALAACMLLMLSARTRRLPAWGVSAMRWLSCGVPLLWLMGSLNGGSMSVPEIVFLVLVALVAWATWLVFKSVNQAENPER